ncbi:MAG: hypothetical protein IJA42_03050 [Bacteroidales bacterium]|nr:hypothetical protein [Bacteroidales bacterium]
MKKIIISIIFALGFGMSLNAQNDGFFTYSDINDTRNDSWGEMPTLPYSHGLDGHVQSDAPLGSGILVLAGLGLTYALRRNKK